MPKITFPNKLLVAFSFFWSINMSAQGDLESLKKTIFNAKVHDTTKLYAIVVLLGNVYDAKEFDSYNALLGKLALKGLANKDNSSLLQNKYKKYLADYYGNVSVRYEEDGNPKSLAYIDKAIVLYKEIDTQNELHMAIVSKGLILYQKRQYKKAIDSYFTALRYFEQHPQGNEDNIWYVYSNLGILYTEQGQHLEAIKYYRKATHFIDIKKEKATVEDELQKCNLYINVGFCYIALKQYNEAAANLNIALALARKHEPNPYVSLALGRLGLIDLKRRQYDSAEQKLTEAYKISEDGFSKGLTLVNLGEVYFRKANYPKAEIMLEKGVESAKAINNAKLLTQAYNLLYRVSKVNGNYKKSVAMLELFHQFNDSSKAVETQNEMKQQLLKYNYEKKELNLKLENERKNNLLIGLSALLGLLFVIGYFLYKSNKQKQAIANFEKNELNQKLLLSQMNPHFIFNSIDNIQSLIYNKQDKEAVNYLTKFSKLTRQILENSNESYIALSEELTMIDNYLVIQQLLYNNKFDFTIDVDEAIDTEAILLPPMLTQPFIENAIKHGLKNTTDKGLINISFKFDNGKLFFEITDNGVGFANIETTDKKSLAMKITKERLVNISGKNDFEVHTDNRLDDKKKIIGAKVFFEIPYIYEN
jgi:tetratricopeptide (TPR) repeat protein